MKRKDLVSPQHITVLLYILGTCLQTTIASPSEQIDYTMIRGEGETPDEMQDNRCRSEKPILATIEENKLACMGTGPFGKYMSLNTTGLSPLEVS